jgi:hypothetical protein
LRARRATAAASPAGITVGHVAVAAVAAIACSGASLGFSAGSAATATKAASAVAAVASDGHCMGIATAGSSASGPWSRVRRNGSVGDRIAVSALAAIACIGFCPGASSDSAGTVERGAIAAFAANSERGG